MSSFSLSYYSRQQRELADKAKCPPVMSPFDVITVVYEVIQAHMLMNPPDKLGFAFAQKYSQDENASDIALEVKYDWKGKAPQKRPAVFIGRGDARLNSPTLGQGIGYNVAESEEIRTNLFVLPISVTTIAQGIGFAEQFAEYIKYPLMYFAQEIQKEYRFHKFRLVNVGRPEIFDRDAKDTYAVDLTLETQFYDTWMVKGDHLKLKTMATTIVTGDPQKPLLNQ